MRRQIKTVSRLDLRSLPDMHEKRAGYDRHPDEAVEIAKRVEIYAKQFDKRGKIRFLMRKANDD